MNVLEMSRTEIDEIAITRDMWPNNEVLIEFFTFIQGDKFIVDSDAYEWAHVSSNLKDRFGIECEPIYNKIKPRSGSPLSKMTFVDRGLRTGCVYNIKFNKPRYLHLESKSQEIIDKNNRKVKFDVSELRT